MTKLVKQARELQRHVQREHYWRQRFEAENKRLTSLVKIVDLYCSYIDDYESEPFISALDAIQTEHDLTTSRICALAEKRDEEQYIVNQELAEVEKLAQCSDNAAIKKINFRKYINRNYYTNVWVDDPSYDFEATMKGIEE